MATAWSMLVPQVLLVMVPDVYDWKTG